MAGAAYTFPLFGISKHLQHLGPFIPKIIGYAPHIGMLFYMAGLVNRRCTRRCAKYNSPATLIYGFFVSFYLGCTIWPRQVINLNKINTPLCIEVEYGV